VTYVLFSTRGWPRILGAWGDQGTLVAARFQVRILPTNRAPRYPFEMTIRYRAAGSDEWFQGETLNVSDSGVLFRTPSYAPGLEETLEMALEMSSLGPRITDVACRGRVVRTGTCAGSIIQIAATIDRYELTRSRR